MSMLTLNGKVVNVYESPKGLNKATGEAYGGQHRIQLMCENMLKNGELKIELIDLTVDSIQEYSDKCDQIVSVPVGVYVAANKVAFYALK
jgi:hypothetical protein